MVWGLMVMPSFIVFVSVSLIGLVFVFLSTGLLGLWISLELGFFGFIPILNGKTVSENEAAAKYFVVQGVGSGLMLAGMLLMSCWNYFSLNSFNVDLIVYSLLMFGFTVKLGVFPFHFWFPTVMSCSSWFSCFWLSVIQKIGPFWGISGLGLTTWAYQVFTILLIFTSLVGSFGGLAQTQFRPLLAYSSLGQTGWMGLIVILNLKIFLFYMFIYGMLLTGLLSSLYVMNSFKVVNFGGFLESKGIFFWLFSGSFFMSLSGVPPLLGCSLKLMGVMVIINNFPLFLSLLILSSMVSLYFYLSIFISSVVCLTDCNMNFYNSVFSNKGIFFFIIFFMLINWFGGLPLFLMCGSMLI
uniref:NADH-ubiquinone oxidoreductase chain 2 n=1 Tax=Semelidae sp. STW-2017 TaxID=1969324 RepID=A0A1U9XPC5_9BIVA|nr:NADH dehydrogenase subunit 2 [Semelidae sp. STW-2017]